LNSVGGIPSRNIDDRILNAGGGGAKGSYTGVNN
jgi:hypothetical protein